ncbi:MAG: TlpA family protein disulfide reductase [Actinomycetales bacterium]
MTRLRTWLVVVVVTAGLALAGCGSSIDTAANSNDGSSGNTIEQIAAADRGAAYTVSGKTLDGQTLSTASWRGQVVVLNYWGSWCPPCVKETPDLKAAWEQLKGKNVEFLGLDAQESAETGKAYADANGLTYPSLQWDGGSFLLQLKGKAPAPPVTIVLDQQGRLAARVLAPVRTATLVGLVEDVQKEPAG